MANLTLACSDDSADEPSDGGTRPLADTGSGDSGPRDAAVLDAATASPDAMTPPHCVQARSWVDPFFTAVQVSTLEVLCNRFNCAKRIEDAIVRATGSCLVGVAEESCGITTVYDAWAVHHFDTESNTLVGAAFGSDIFFDFAIEGCEAAFFQAGTAPGPCAWRVRGDLCDDAGTADAGE